MADIKKFAEVLVNLSVKDVNELATILKDEYGIEPAAAAVAVGPAAAASGSAASTTDEHAAGDAQASFACLTKGAPIEQNLGHLCTSKDLAIFSEKMTN